MATPRSLRTRARILDAALDLYERQGYAATTVDQVAAAAGVTAMTFFRHFPSKDATLVSDPYDPIIAMSVAGQPTDLGPLERVRRGMLEALSAIPPVEDKSTLRRVRLLAHETSLHAAVTRSTRATQDAIVERLVEQGTPRLDATVAASACLSAATTALLTWAETADDTASLADPVRHALELLGPHAETTGSTS